MSNDFENSQEYRKALEIAKKQEELYKNVTKAISPEALAKFQELSNKLSEWKNSLNNMPGLLKFAEMLKNYQQEVRVTEGLTEAEFEEKYRSEIEWSEKFGKNGWVISEHSLSLIHIFFAICIGPFPATHKSKIRFTTAAASSSTIHFFLSFRSTL